MPLIKRFLDGLVRPHIRHPENRSLRPRVCGGQRSGGRHSGGRRPGDRQTGGQLSGASRPAEQGFTLIEVLVALAIIAVAMGAALRATQVMLDNSRAIRGKTLALLAAENTLAQLRLERAFPRAGTQTRPCPQGNIALRCEIEIRNSMNRNFRQVTVRVNDADRDGVTLTQLSGLLSQVR
ncbi:type II secretion system minor pseudopilin GspI [Bordetella genomosp. 4]|uniref:type II secretion system minor pseudopilin GspI n=1 Tax=Bordetella genomosp. 4 TaxID=463044 RepID=UPI000B9E31D1|nr:type II secretion system protein GspI [Bordetella genomosp. 4]